jgi:dTDP-4-amino-4,6-dideoxygalactose transaminase
VTKPIRFNIPLITGNELDNLQSVIVNDKFSGDGEYTKKCNSWLESNCKVSKALLTTSCTHALEMAAILIDTKSGDEIIMPSYTFVSSANPFILRGARIVFIDIRPDTMNMDETKVEDAITENTKAIVPVHYAGVACEMDTIMSIASKYNLFVIEDAAQGLMSTYRGRPLGSIGHIGCLSFHETKNYQCGEGGAVLLNDKSFNSRAEIIREKGTNRSQFIRGMVDKYRWVDIGSSYLPSELNAAFLFAQLENANEVNNKRLSLWREYSRRLTRVSKVNLQFIPDNTEHNAHMFYIKLKDINERQGMIEYLNSHGIQSVFHYIPLHESRKCSQYNSFSGKDEYTTKESERLLRLPMHYDLEISDVKYICNKVKEFFND